MKTTKAKYCQSDIQALFEELETRFGVKMAREIVAQIKLAQSGANAPSYMVVKTCSEMLELFRGETQGILAGLKHGRDKWRGNGSKISFFEKRKLETEFRRVYRLYWVSMKLFYPLYDQAMASYQKKLNAPFTNTTDATEMRMAA